MRWAIGFSPWNFYVFSMGKWHFLGTNITQKRRWGLGEWRLWKGAAGIWHCHKFMGLKGKGIDNCLRVWYVRIEYFASTSVEKRREKTRNSNQRQAAELHWHPCRFWNFEVASRSTTSCCLSDLFQNSFHLVSSSSFKLLWGMVWVLLLGECQR